jgi:heme-degrading monooxygenase HmoA
VIAVIFEVEPKKEGYQTYLEHAAALRPLLETVDGFISVERFQSLTNPNKLVSLSFWRDEECVRAWREHSAHRNTQAVGRAGVFDNYRLRVAHVERDYGLYERAEAPPFHSPIDRPFDRSLDRPHEKLMHASSAQTTAVCPVLPPLDL